VHSLSEEKIENLEIIVVDDGSTAQNFIKLKQSIGNSVRLLRNDTAMGASAARNRGIIEATGDYITFLDDDDLNIPGRIKGQLELAIRHNADFVTCSRLVYETQYGTRIQGKFLAEISLQNMWLRNVVVNVTPLVDINLMRSVMFDTSLPVAEDYDAWLRCLQQCCRTINYSGLAIRYRRSGKESLNANRGKKLKGRISLYRKHHKIMPPHIKIYFLLMSGAKWMMPDPKFVWYLASDWFFSKIRSFRKYGAQSGE